MTDQAGSGESVYPFTPSPGADVCARSDIRPRIDTAALRTEADDERIALHEASHAVVGRFLGQPLGGCTCDEGDGFSGRCWGPTFQSKFAGGPSAPSLCAQIAPLMPFPGESRADVADIFAHCHVRTVELTAGSVGESLFLPGEPWQAADDRAQELALASLIASSSEAVEAFVDFCAVEAAAILRPLEYIIRALTAELLVRRTMNAEQIDAVIAAAVAREALTIEQARRADMRRATESAARFLEHQERI
jgi:hypothetical protein